MSEHSKTRLTTAKAWKFVILIGIVSLFADTTYEGARSIAGQYLALLGASATAIGVIAGLGEFIGYAFRLVAGFIADRTRRYWMLTFFGYAINVLTVPTLALVGRWEIAAALMFAERFGKGMRTPVRDAMLSHASSQTGRGMAFGVHEALDQIGAILGPMLMALVLHYRSDYRMGFLTLLAPAILTLLVLLLAWLLYPQPQRMEIQRENLPVENFPKRFWLYLLFASFAVAGFPHFQILAYHFKVKNVLTESAIPAAFGLAMATDAVAALVTGRWFDRLGLKLLFSIPLLTLVAAFALFKLQTFGAWSGMVFWGVVMGAQESVMRAAIAEMATKEKRATAYGIFNASYGLAWMLGSAAIGWLYDQQSINGLLMFISVTQISSLLFLLYATKPERSKAL